METYLNLLKKLTKEGEIKNDRTGTGTISTFGDQIEIDISAKFPLITTKYVHFKSVAVELLWFLKGGTNIDYLNKYGVNIWNEWADKEGNLGKIYGYQWTNWNGINQIEQVVNQIKINPNSRRLIVSAWNVSDIQEMALPPCHTLFQFYVNSGSLSCKLYQRSADIFLGVPFNIASYALLTYMVAHVTGLKPNKLIISFGDLHLYHNHITQAIIQLERETMELPTIELNQNINNIFDFTLNDIKLVNYNSHSKINAPVAV